MRFGPHTSIAGAGGLENAPKNARKAGADIYQIFTRSPRGGPAKFAPQDIKNLKALNQQYGYDTFYIHAPYYLNLASPKSDTYQSSIRILIEELKAAEKLGARYVVTHLGSAKASSQKAALKKIIRALQAAGQKAPLSRLLLEHSAGQGETVGHKFSQLAAILDAASVGGICLDSAHLFAAGFNIKTKAGLDKTLQEFDKKIGFKRLKLWHLNDSKTELGSRKDRHQHIGQGYIGKAGFKNILAHPALQQFDFILETPKKSYKDDRANLRILRRLARQPKIG